MSWHRWQRICGWAALVCAALWAAKFTIVSLGAHGDFPRALIPVAAPLVGFIVPTVGSILMLVIPFALAAPYLGGRRLRVSLPVTLAVGVVAIVAIALLQATAQGALSSSSDFLREEGAVLVSAALCMLAACWLLRPRLDRRPVAVALATGGVLWLAKGIAVAAGAPLGGWTMVGYQIGLWLLAAVALVAVFDSVRHRRYALPLIVAAAYVGAGVLGSIPVLGGELGLLGLSLLALGAAAVQWTRSSPPKVAQV